MTCSAKKINFFSHIFGVKYRKQTVVATENLSVHSSEKPFLYVDRGYGIFLSRKAISKMLTFLCDKIVIYFHTFKFLKYSNTSWPLLHTKNTHFLWLYILSDRLEFLDLQGFQIFKKVTVMIIINFWENDF